MIKQYFYLLILLIIISSCEGEKKVVKKLDENTIASDSTKVDIEFKGENFFIFFKDFCSDPEFQAKRIIFPLKEEFLSEDLSRIITNEINTGDWEYVELKKFEDNTFEYFFNNFNKMDIPDTDEKVFSVMGIENGININYFFRRINYKWFLIKIQDFST